MTINHNANGGRLYYDNSHITKKEITMNATVLKETALSVDYHEWSFEKLLNALEANCAVIASAKQKSDEIVQALIENQVSLFCKEKGNIQHLTKLLDRIGEIKNAKTYYDKIIKGLPIYTGLPMIISYNKTTKKHMIRLTASNLQELEAVKKQIAQLCKDITEGKKPGMFASIDAHVKKEKEAKKARPKNTIAREKCDALIRYLDANILHTPEKMEALKKAINDFLA